MKLRWFILLVACALSVAGSVAAGATYLERLSAVWGRDMTVGQFLRAVDPETLPLTTARMRETKVTWGSPDGTAALASRANKLLSDLPSITVLYDIDEMTVYGYVVSYGALTKVTSPWHYCLPYMWLRVRLLYNGSTLAQRIVQKTNVWQVSIDTNCNMPGPGTYQSVSYHYVEFPPGYEQTSEWCVGETPARWVDW
jgi:hypothetical protein